MDFQETIHKIVTDRKSGSVSLALNFIESILQLHPSEEEIMKGLNRLKKAFPEMNVFTKIEEYINEKIQCGHEISKIFQDLRGNISNSQIILAKKALSIISKSDTILTFSNSNTLRNIITVTEASKVYIPVSDPGGEGRYLFNAVKTKSGVQLVEDENIPKIIKNEKPKIVLSCDSVVPNRGFVNKVGTKWLCTLAEKYETNVILFGGWLKERSTPPEKIESSLLEWIPWFNNILYVTDN